MKLTAIAKRLGIDAVMKTRASSFYFAWLDGYGPQFTVEWTGAALDADRWAIRRSSQALSRTGEWDYEPSPSNRTGEWLDDHRFTRLEALVIATRLERRLLNSEAFQTVSAPLVIVNMTATQAAEFYSVTRGAVTDTLA